MKKESADRRFPFLFFRFLILTLSFIAAWVLVSGGGRIVGAVLTYGDAGALKEQGRGRSLPGCRMLPAQVSGASGVTMAVS